MIGHKTRLSKFEKINIISSIFSDHNGMKLEINSRRKAEKNHKYVEIKQYTSEQPMGQRRNQKGNKKYLETNENGKKNTKTYGMQQKQFQGKSL